MGELVESIAATIDRYRAGDPFGRAVTWALTARYLEVD